MRLRKTISFLGLIFCVEVFMMAQANNQSTLSKAEPFDFSPRIVAEGTAADCSSMNTPITEKQRITVSKDGHLECGGKRIRIFGTNISSIPPKSEAAYWAKVLSSQGFNCIRWHHFDSTWTNCFLLYSENGKPSYNWQKIDDFDYFYNELKKVGIYSDINMLVGRDYKTAEGFPRELSNLGWKEKHALGFWNEAALNLQKDYAKTILTHKNPYTGFAYTEDPATAIIEINNENGLLMSYENGTLDKYPSSVIQELEDKYNDWLKKKNYTLSSLQSQFNRIEQPGKALISNDAQFYLEQHEGAQAKIENKNNGFEIKIEKNGMQSWHVQVTQGEWPVQNDKIYTLSFKAKASRPSTVNVSVMMARHLWKDLNFSENIQLTTKEQTFTYTISTFTTDKTARLNISNMGFAEGTKFTFKDISLVEGGSEILIHEGAKKGTVQLPKFSRLSKNPPEYKKIVLEFLYDTEQIYWHAMNTYIKNELSAKALTMGTICGTTTQGIMDEFDIIDSHAYWHHPVFPEKDWDMSRYYVTNEDMATSKTGGILTDLGVQRVYGKPFSVTEYDLPYPNQYSSEMLPMVASYASLQDWDCLFSFAYELSQKDKKYRVNGYFDQGNNPSKTPANIVASRIFRNYLVEPAREKVYVLRDRKSEIDSLPKTNAWDFTSASILNIPIELGLVHQIGVFYSKDGYNSMMNSVGGNLVLASEKRAEVELLQSHIDQGKDVLSDTGEILWNAAKGNFIVHAKKAFVTVAHTSENGAVTGQKESSSKTETSYSPYISFNPKDDFSVVFGAEYKRDKFAIYSCSWSGNYYADFRDYNEKKHNNIEKFRIVRENINLTTDKTLGIGNAFTLASEGTLILQALSPQEMASVRNPLLDLPSVYQCTYRLFKLNADGTRANEVTGLTTLSTLPQTMFPMNRNDGTLWYELEVVRAQD
jgi:hypothetical protein